MDMKTLLGKKLLLVLAMGAIALTVRPMIVRADDDMNIEPPAVEEISSGGEVTEVKCWFPDLEPTTEVEYARPEVPQDLE